jgi:hypothetical protein
MSIVAIIVIVVVVALVLLALLFLVRRFGDRARVKKRELELRQRRKQVVSEHREEAETREQKAEEAQRRARIAEQEATRERAEAQLRQEKADLHERGLADHDLIEEHERERFAGTSAVAESNGEAEQRSSAYAEGRRSAGDPSRLEDFKAGRRRELDD